MKFKGYMGTSYLYLRIMGVDMVFSFILRLLSLILLIALSHSVAVAQDGSYYPDENAWPSPEEWVGKKPSELLDTHPPSNDKRNFFEAIEDNGAIGPFIFWPYHYDKFTKIERPVVRIDNYLVFWANDCGDKVCHEGFAFVYDMKNDIRILCEHKRESATHEVPDLENTVDEDDSQYKAFSISNDTVTFFVIARQSREEISYPKITKTGENLSCGGGGGEAADAEAIQRQLIWIGNLIFAR